MKTILLILVSVFFLSAFSCKKGELIKSQVIQLEKEDDVIMFVGKAGETLEGGDPNLLIASDGYYYLYSTGQSTGANLIPAWKSKDLKNWENIRSVISERPYVATGNPEDKNNNYLWNYWSPDVYEENGKYYLFVTGPVLKSLTTDFLDNQLNISTYVAQSDNPVGPFEKFVMIKPRNNELNAPRSVLNKDSVTRISQGGYQYYFPIRVDFHIFNDPKTQKIYVAYTGYGNPASKNENGNHIVFFDLVNPEFVSGDDGRTPGYYYDYKPESVVHASNPLDWPEFGDSIPTNRDKFNNTFIPIGDPFKGYPRGVTEAPSLNFKDGRYQLYFSVNTWDSPSYQIVCVEVKDIMDFEIETRKSLPNSMKKIRVFKKYEKDGTYFINCGSGGVFVDKDEKQYYVLHIMDRYRTREIGIKEIP